MPLYALCKVVVLPVVRTACMNKLALLCIETVNECTVDNTYSHMAEADMSPMKISYQTL